MIESLLFMALFLMLPIFWLGLLRLSGVRLLTISIPGALIASILIWQYIGFPILFFQLNDYRAVLIQDRSIILQMFLWSSYSITMILFGFVAARKNMGPLHLPNQFNAYYDTVKRSVLAERWILYAIFSASVAVLAMYIQRVGINNLAFLSVIGFIESDVSQNMLRSNMGNAFEGRYHWFRLFMRDFLSIASLGFFAHWLMCRRWMPFVIFSASFVVVAFSMVMATEKGPILWYLISLFILYVIVFKSGRLTVKLIATMVPFGMVLIGLMYMYFMGSSSIWVGIQGGFSRITSGQIVGLYHYLDIFPDQVDYLLGRSLPNPRGIFPWEHYRLIVEVKNIVQPELAKQGIVGSMPTFFWGEMYANFGYLGILIPPFFVGYVVYVINILIFRLPMSPVTLAFFIWALLYIKTLSGTGLGRFLFPVWPIIMASSTLLALGLMSRGVIRFRKKRMFRAVSHL